MRYLANGSSGRMGFALTEVAVQAGHEVVLVAGPTALSPALSAVYRPITSALEMRDEVARVLRETTPPIEVVVMVAAVADYRPAVRDAGKPKKSDAGLTLQLVPNPDILAELGARRSAGELSAVLVGFALESGTPEETVAKGTQKLERKGLDLIVVNTVSAVGSPDNEVTLVYRTGSPIPGPTGPGDPQSGRVQHLGRMDKSEVAAAILTAALGILDCFKRSGDGQTDSKRGKTQ